MGRAEKDKLFREILSACPSVLCVLDGDCVVQFVSPSAREVLGYEEDALIGRPLTECLPDQEAVVLRRSMDESAASGSAAGLVIHEFLRGDGKEAVLEASVTPLHKDGERGRWLLIGIDATRRILTEQLLVKLSSAVEQIDESLVITDRQGVIIYVNRAFEKTTGYTAAEVIGKTPRILKSGKHHPDFYKDLWETLLAGRSYHGVVTNRKKDGTLFHEEKTITPLRDSSGAITSFVATGADVTQRKLDEERLLEGAERFALSIRGANDGLWDWDLRTGRLYLSDRWKSMLGFADHAVGDALEDWFGLVHPDDLAGLKEKLRRHLSGSEAHFEHEHRIRDEAGTYRWVLTRGMAVRDDRGKAYRVAGSQTEITSRKLVEEQLQHDALHDPLTSLPNRTLFLDRLSLAIARAARKPEDAFAVLFLDLDRFKMVNDSLGHLAGDQLLIELANRLVRCLRSSDTVARLGGDEFAILLENISDASTASHFVRRVMERIAEPFRLMGREIFTSGSVGVTLYASKYTAPDEVIRDADIAMYEAKKLGRNRFVIFDAAMHAKAMGLLELETDLRKVVKERGLSVHYQPIVSLKSGHVAGFEALLRWHHPARGLVPPSQFIPLAEDSGLIDTIGPYILREACREISRLQRRFPRVPPLTMSVNLSGVQFLRTQLMGEIDLMLRENGLDPQSLKLEITESAIIEHAQHAGDMMAQLRAQQIHLSIDDFGTGYSSMSYLKRYPIDSVKIDQSFVQRICEDKESREIVRATISMAHNLAMEVVAEGVETWDQVALLKDLNCEYGQGYYFARPMPGDQVEPFLAGGRVM